MVPRRVNPDRQRPAYTVFISHSGDTWIAKKIAEEIENRGARTFLDETQVDSGDVFQEKIRGALKSASELLVLLTPTSVKRPFVWVELGVAWQREIRIIGVLHAITVDEILKSPEFPIILKERDLVELNDIDQYFAELQNRLKQPGSQQRRGAR